jgi:hypothetical protein
MIVLPGFILLGLLLLAGMGFLVVRLAQWIGKKAWPPPGSERGMKRQWRSSGNQGGKVI